MKKNSLKAENTSVLISRLVDLIIQEGRVQDSFYINPADQTKEYNRLCTYSYPIQQELAARGPEAERQLLPLLDHPNPWVRKVSAGQLLPLEEERARAVLEKIIVEAHRFAAIGPEARSTLHFWDEGIYKGIKPARPVDRPSEGKTGN